MIGLISDSRVHEARGTINQNTFSWLAFENHNITVVTFSQNSLGTLIHGFWQVATQLPERQYFKLWVPAEKWTGFQLDLTEGFGGEIIDPSNPNVRFYYNIIGAHVLQVLLDYYQPAGFLRLDDFWNPENGFFGCLQLRLSGDEIVLYGGFDEESGVGMECAVSAADLFVAKGILVSTEYMAVDIPITVEEDMQYWGCTPNGQHNLTVEAEQGFVFVTFPVSLPSSIEESDQLGPYQTVGVKFEDFVGLVTLLQEVHQGR